MKTYQYRKEVNYGSSYIRKNVDMRAITYIGIAGYHYFMDEDKLGVVENILSSYLSTNIEMNRFPQIHLLSFRNDMMLLSGFVKFIKEIYNKNIFENTNYIKFQYHCYDSWKNGQFSGFVKFSEKKRYDGVRLEKLKTAISKIRV